MPDEECTPSIPTKCCTKCKEFFPATREYFYKQRQYLTPGCQACIKAEKAQQRAADPEGHRAYQQAQRLTDPERYREYARNGYARHIDDRRTAGRSYRATHLEECRTRSRTYNRDNKEKVLAQTQAWRKENTAHIAAYNSTYYTEHKAKINQQHQAWYQATLEEQRAKARAYAKAHPDERAAIDAQRRARLANAPINDLTVKQWREIKAHYRYCCVYCGKRPKKLTKDHLTPISKGGSNTASNVVPACSTCNSRKYNGPPLCPVQPLLLL